MKLKLLLLNNVENIIYVERYQNDWCKVYYQDKHYEIYYLTVNRFLKQLNYNKPLSKIYKAKYHSPLIIGSTLFSPTRNIKHPDCEYFNLLKIDENDSYYENVLREKQLLDTAKKRYLEYRQSVLYNNEK